MKNKEEFINIMQLAKFSVANEDTDTLYEEFTDILNVIKMIDDVDLSGYNCEDDIAIAVMRDDEPVPSLPVDVILSNAIETQDNFFSISKQ